MAVPPKQLEALDKAQAEIHRVLESAGRIFAAANGGNRSTALAAASRLKQVLPGSMHNFHAALDELSEHLHYARLVMQRDLAICREKDGSHPGIKAIPESAPQDKPVEVKSEDSVAIDTKGLEAAAVEADQKPSEGPLPKHEAVQDQKQDSNADTSASIVIKTDDEAKGVEDESSKLAVDTTLKPPPADIQPAQDDLPDAIQSANVDNDSLFNDPASAGGFGGDNLSPASGPDFGAGDNAGGDFDFDAFGAGLNNEDQAANFASLLPGLTAYANGQTNKENEPDFSTIFGNGGDLPNQDQVPDGSQGNGEQKDMTFDDLMDFNFDMDDANGDAANSGDNTLQFDFS